MRISPQIPGVSLRLPSSLFKNSKGLVLLWKIAIALFPPRDSALEKPVDCAPFRTVLAPEGSGEFARHV
jgi:hypothetical protein